MVEERKEAIKEGLREAKAARNAKRRELHNLYRGEVGASSAESNSVGNYGLHLNEGDQNDYYRKFGGARDSR
jgi:hypothetical protein